MSQEPLRAIYLDANSSASGLTADRLPSREITTHDARHPRGGGQACGGVHEGAVRDCLWPRDHSIVRLDHAGRKVHLTTAAGPRALFEPARSARETLAVSAAERKRWRPSRAPTPGVPSGPRRRGGVAACRPSGAVLGRTAFACRLRVQRPRADRTANPGRLLAQHRGRLGVWVRHPPTR